MFSDGAAAEGNPHAASALNGDAVCRPCCMKGVKTAVHAAGFDRIYFGNSFLQGQCGKFGVAGLCWLAGCGGMSL